MSDRWRRSGPDVERVVQALTRVGVTDLGYSPLERSLYASDASIYRIEPLVVARPRNTNDLHGIMRVCHDLDVPLTMRGAGTSCAGNAIGPGVVVDTSRHLTTIEEINVDERWARVQPGVIAQSLSTAVRSAGLIFGPDPSTVSRCTIGGMIGNNACGARSMTLGRTVDTVRSLNVLTGSGDHVVLRAGGADPVTAHAQTAGLVKACAQIAEHSASSIGAECGTFPRHISGYGLHYLLPQHGFDVAKAFVGSEGTLGVLTSATVQLTNRPSNPHLVVMGLPAMDQAADLVPALLALQPTACEGIGEELVERVKQLPGQSLSMPIPPGRSWLLIEVAGPTGSEALERAKEVLAIDGAGPGLIITDPDHVARWWKLRSDAAGLASRTVDGRPCYAGWEDSAVPPDRLGDYLRDLQRLLSEHHLQGAPYGHLGEGCVHLRIDFPLGKPEGPEHLSKFMSDAADLVVRYGGSLSGEHGDGRARSALLSRQYSPTLMTAFTQFKQAWDPRGLLNPGVIVDADALDEHVRKVPGRENPVSAANFAFAHDQGRFDLAVHRCSGVGACVGLKRDNTVMCPSFQATQREQDSTRGRSRVLQDAVSGDLGPAPWRNSAVQDAMADCLACKACASDCPTGIDMATYKAQVLHWRFRRRLRPWHHYTIGLLPQWLSFLDRIPGLRRVARAGLSVKVLNHVAARVLGVDPRRRLPIPAATSLQQWWRANEREAPPSTPRPIMIFADSFSTHLATDAAQALITVLRDAGYQPVLSPPGLCCGLTCVTTGNLNRARTTAATLLRALRPHLEQGGVIVGIEPSCTAALRTDVPDLVLADPVLASELGATARLLRTHTRFLAQVLWETPDWSPPDLSGVTIVAQPHCHQRATAGWDADQRLLEQAGAAVTRVDNCCGMAGSFGMTRDHHDLSMAVAGLGLTRALQQMGEEAVVLADGFSCQTQLASLGCDRPLTLAQVLLSAGLPTPRGSG